MPLTHSGRSGAAALILAGGLLAAAAALAQDTGARPATQGGGTTSMDAGPASSQKGAARHHGKSGHRATHRSASGTQGRAAPAGSTSSSGAGPQNLDNVAIDNSGNYQQELQACRSGRTAQDTATCLQEARNAQAERRRGGLTTPESLQANAMARCNVFRTDEDKRACEARVMGQGETSGTVAGGGILHEYAYEVPAPQDQAQDQQQGGAMGAGPGGSSASDPSSSGASPSTGPSQDPMEEEMEDDDDDE